MLLCFLRIALLFLHITNLCLHMFNRCKNKIICLPPGHAVSPVAMCGGVFLAFCTFCVLCAETKGNDVCLRPNVIFILADDMGYGDLGCQNSQSKIPTPNLDRLAGEGMRFTDAHSPSSVCTPTRYSILTGRYCWRSRLKKGVLGNWQKPLIEHGRMTVADLFRQCGYDTACIGKWHLGWDWPLKDGKQADTTSKPTRLKGPGKNIDFTKPLAGGPTDRGFDYYFGDDVPNFPPYCFIENDRVTEIPTEMKPESMFGLPGPMVKGWKLEKVMPKLTAKAIRYIQDRARKSPRKPFFLYFALTAPHTPIAPSEEFQGKSQAGPYGDFVYQVDDTVGQVLTLLEETGLAENTLLIFTSDNGSPGRSGVKMCGPHRSVEKYGHHPSRPWRGIKADAWDGGHRVPFVVRWPGHVPAGSVNDKLICHVDFMATTAAILGKDLPKHVAEDSYSILPAMLGEKLNQPIRESVIHHSYCGLFCVRKGNWKLILGLGAGGFSGPIRQPKPGEPLGQLYDMQGDPGEKTNVYKQYPEIVAELSALLDTYKKSGKSTPNGLNE